MPQSLEVANFRYAHPMGVIFGFITERGLRELDLPQPEKGVRHVHLLHSAPNVTLGRRLNQCLDDYFAGLNVTFGDIPLDLEAGTKFQRAVWEGARAIPWGETRSYGALAEAIGKPRAARAVGGALGANPVPILVPCHRILGADGSLTGFGCGLDWKRTLLEREGIAV
jgi:methylated-DNA-[protein]-cysteine S-methyltransferase